ncbi:CASP-like protein 5B2 isoform X1 [Primulina eburnea]|uniref:CASP-like protein 5B2 isoform X1 n=1 Tax=Primulina eburnea TaxID=1245227 RepID=UPI003C6C4EBB
MKEVFGSPGKRSGLVIRIGQCLCAAGSVGIMASASGFSTTTAFCYLIGSMGLQVLWSFGLACLDIHALRFNKDLLNHFMVSLLVVGDWVTATLSLAAASSSAGVMVFFTRDTSVCAIETKFACIMFQISITLAFATWFLIAYSSCVTFWLVASF